MEEMHYIQVRHYQYSKKIEESIEQSSIEMPFEDGYNFQSDQKLSRISYASSGEINIYPEYGGSGTHHHGNKEDLI